MNGNGPSPDYLAMINSTLSGAPPPGAGPIMLGNSGGPPAVPPPMAPPPPPMPPPVQASQATAPPAPPPPPMPPPAQAGPPPGQPSPGFLQHLSRGGVQNVAAKETEMRGPQLKQAQGARNEAFEGAIQAVTERSQHTAAADYALALEQERKAGIREDAANYSVAERGAEMEQRQADFDQSVKALSQQSVDPDRFWANASVGRKIAVLLSAGLAGFVNAKQGHGAGSNVGVDTAMRLADQDIKAQEFAYTAARDTVNAKQTAFGMAMQKYQNVDMARAAARAAAMETVQAQLAQQSALWKGTEAANRGQMAIASLQDEKMQQIAQGIMFAPARQVAVAGKWRDPRTGLEYTDQEAKGIAKTMDENEFKHGEKVADVAGNLMVEREKAGAKGNDKLDEGTRFIAEKLQTAGVPQARAAAEEAKRLLNKTPGGSGEKLGRDLLGDGPLANKVMSTDANAREQAYHAFENAAMKALMGNVTKDELGRAQKQFGDAHDPASRVRAVDSALSMLADVEKGIKAGTSPEVQTEYDRRRQHAEGAPPAAPKAATQGWK